VSKPIYDRLVFYEGDDICLEGEPGVWAFLIQTGKVGIIKRRVDGTEVMLAVLGPGRLFGEMALIDDLPRMATARALAKTTVILIDREIVLSKINKSPPLVRELLQNLTSNLRSMTRRHVELGGNSAEEPEPRPYVGPRLT
jgi:CRP-like cAMP-binding protein